MIKLVISIVLSVVLYAPDNWSGYDKMKDYFWNLQKRHYVEVLKYFNDPVHIKAFICVIWSESNFKESAYNGYDAGICQNNRVHGPKEKFMDYKVSIKYGSEYFNGALIISNNDIAFAAARYNGGYNVNLTKYKNWKTYVQKICFKAYELRDIRI